MNIFVMLPPQMASRVLIICRYTFQMVAGRRNAITANQKILHFMARLIRYCLKGPGAPLLLPVYCFELVLDEIFIAGNSGVIVCMVLVLVLRKRCQLRVVYLLVTLFAKGGKGITLFKLLKKRLVHATFKMPHMGVITFCM